MPNENVLDGMACPKCGNERSFSIAAEVFVVVYDDGIEDYGDAEWTGESYCRCRECDFTATVKDFHVEDEDENA